VASTLLAVDDSVTMRKVLEITFAGPDFRVVTANSPDTAMAKLKSDKVDLVIADLSLEPMNGYDLCKAIKKASPATPVLLLSSKQNAYDAARGGAAQADEHMDKPFDTQQMIDKVKKLLAAGAGAPVAGAARPAEKATSPSQTTPSMQAPVTASAAAKTAPAAQALPPAAAAAVAAMGNAPVQRAKTLIYNPPAAGGAVPAAAPAQRAPAGPTPVSGLPQQARTLALESAPAPAAATPAPAAAAAPVAALVNGQLHAKLEQLGLTPAQVEAVAALSREVVERVVWEVVPVLAETLIREELSRLTK
jgi:CheY-like chemotaxis protein